MDPMISGSVTPFYTFDPLQGEGTSELVDILEKTRTEGVDDFASLSTKYPEMASKLEAEGINVSAGRNEITWDDATILFIAIRATEGDGGPAEPFDRGVSTERLGRFPTEDGNSISYLRENLIPESPDDSGYQLLTQLDCGFRKEKRGHEHLSLGFGGLKLHGWLSKDDVTELRNYLQKSIWKVANDETFDGGVRDVVRHLVIILKTAEKRNLGVLMRAH